MTGNIVHDLPSWMKDVGRRVELLERRRQHRGTGTSGGGGGSSRVLLPTSGDITPGAAAGTDYVILCSAALTVTLPTAAGNTATYVVKRVGTGLVTVATTGGQLIDGDATFTLTVQYQSVTIASDSANWLVV